MKATLFLFLLSFLHSAQIADNSLLELFSQDVTSSSQSVSGSSNNVGDSGSFGSCDCNISSGECDALCCCDSECPSAFTSAWAADGQCLDTVEEQAIPSLSDCIDKRKQAHQEDLRYPLRSLAVNLKLLFCKVRDTTDKKYTYIDSLLSASSSSEFDSLVSDHDLSASFTNTITYSADSTITDQAYQFGENILGKMNGQASDQNRLKLPAASGSGQCITEGQRVAFGRAVSEFECSYTFTSTNCAGSPLDSTYIQSLQAYATNSLTGTLVSLTAGQISTVDSSRVITSSSLTAFQTQNNCNNVLVEVSEIQSQAEFEFVYSDSQITLFRMNGVYQSFAAQPTNLNLKYSITFTPSSVTTPVLIQSGNPGYLRGYPLLMGTTASNGGITIDTDGFKLKGVNNDGTCQYASSSLFLNEPIITFEEDLIFGCSEKMTYAQLSANCANTWTPQLFQNILTNGLRIGRFGNSNPAYPLDWITVDTSGFNTIQGQFFSNSGICTIEAGAKLEIFVSKAGETEDFQYQVISASLSSQEIDWTFKLRNPNQEQNFNFILTITFYEIPQDSDTFIAGSPRISEPLPRNTLYPFFIDSADWLHCLHWSLTLLLVMNLMRKE